MASSTVNEMSKSSMEEFSKEIHIAIASFLSVNDVVNYQSCNKQLRRMINLHRLDRPSPISINFKSQSYRGVNGRIHFETIIGSSFYFSNLIHSVKLTCYYRYQIFITEKSNQELQQSERDYKDVDRIIAESPLAEHHETKCEFIFKPKPGFMYCLCYRIGGDGGHTLTVRDIKLESFVHSACIPLANILMDTRPTSQQSLFYRNMLQYVLDTVHQQEILGRPSLSFFQSVGLNLMDEQDVEAVHMLLAELESN